MDRKTVQLPDTIKRALDWLCRQQDDFYLRDRPAAMIGRLINDAVRQRGHNPLTLRPLRRPKP